MIDRMLLSGLNCGSGGGGGGGGGGGERESPDISIGNLIAKLQATRPWYLNYDHGTRIAISGHIPFYEPVYHRTILAGLLKPGAIFALLRLRARFWLLTGPGTGIATIT